ncbi:hypothetical protein GC209_03755 [bacterium]|nr:hypothetical protein [bacterium]
MLRSLLALAAAACLAGCSGDHKWASDADVARATYVAGPPASVTLITSINGRSGSGAHSALIINGSQRVLFDPAGSWELTGGQAPERNDLHYGMNPGALQSYLDFQAQGIFYVISQTLPVPLDVADREIAAAAAFGSTPEAFCTHSTSTILRQVPGLESLPVTFFPKALAKSFGKMPGVQSQILQGPDGGKELGAANQIVDMSSGSLTH